jgi:capsular exopolysaccharide synthesis family protein
MGKILNALNAANGDVAEIIRQSLEQPRNGNSIETMPHARAGSNGVGAKHEAIWTRIAESDPAGPDPDAVTGIAWYGMRTHTIPWEVLESAPLLSVAGNEHVAEQYRAVRTRILLSPKAPSTLVVSSPGAGDGKTLTAINLAGTFARKSDHDVLLVDADLRRPAIHSRLGLPQGPGLADILNGQCSLEDAVLRIEQLSNLFVLPSGGAVGNAGELLDSPAWRTVVSRLRAQFRTVIYDSPPVDVFTDFDLIATACDGVILVLTPDCTDRYLAFRALEKVGDKLLGVLINRAEDWFLWKRQASNYYYYRQGTGHKKDRNK